MERGIISIFNTLRGITLHFLKSQDSRLSVTVAFFIGPHDFHNDTYSIDLYPSHFITQFLISRDDIKNSFRKEASDYLEKLYGTP